MAEELSLVISNPNEGEFLKMIDWNKDEFMELVASITEQYKGLTYTEDQMKAAKTDRARLNSMKKAISDRRIEVKNAVMAPYTQFENEVKEVVALIEEPISLIDGQIKEYEESSKKEKRQKLMEHFKDVASNLDGILTFDMIFDQRYLNASISLKKAKEDIDERINQFKTDLRTIETMCEEKYHTIVKDYYMKSQNISKALEEARRMKELDRKLEEDKQRKEEARIKAEEAESKAKEAATRTAETVTETAETVTETHESVSKEVENAIKPVENVTDEVKSVVSPPAGSVTVTDPFVSQEDTKQYKASFTVYGTKAQIMALKQYMNYSNIKFGKVEK